MTGEREGDLPLAVDWEGEDVLFEGDDDDGLPAAADAEGLSKPDDDPDPPAADEAGGGGGDVAFSTSTFNASSLCSLRACSCFIPSITVLIAMDTVLINLRQMQAVSIAHFLLHFLSSGSEEPMILLVAAICRLISG